VTEQRIARVVGRNRDMEVKAFKGADLRGQTDVTVDPGTMLSFSKSERFNMLKEMHQLQVIDTGEFRQNMDISDFAGILEGVAQDRNNAQRENEAWKHGQPVPPAKAYEDHHVHLNQHNYFRKSDAYRMLPPEAQMSVDKHCTYHEQMVLTLSGAPPPGSEMPAGDGMDADPGGPPPTPGEMQGFVDKAIKQGGQELAEGLPPPPPVADLGQEGM
jgi:hypothetical protein